MTEAKRRAPEALRILGQNLLAGQRVTLELPFAQLYTQKPLTVPVHVMRGRRAGPTLFVSAAIHGDEINGVEIIRRLLGLTQLERLRGSLIAVPIVNVHGFIHHTRYLPDRRDLNRSFPGSEKGSLTARLAHLFLNEIVARCSHGIDLHTGAVHRENLPQIRARLDDPATRAMAEAFGVPVLHNADFRDGSLRQVAAERGIPMLLYEGGEALRFNELAIRAGLSGVVGVMRYLGMLPRALPRREQAPPTVARSSTWVRAPESGLVRTLIPLGARVRRGDILARLGDPLGTRDIEVTAPVSGIVIGCSRLPMVNEGDALFHIARFDSPDSVAAEVDRLADLGLEEDPESGGHGA